MIDVAAHSLAANLTGLRLHTMFFYNWPTPKSERNVWSCVKIRMQPQIPHSTGKSSDHLSASNRTHILPTTLELGQEAVQLR